MIIPTRCAIRVSPLVRALLVTALVAACGGRAGTTTADQPVPRQVVSLASLSPTALAPVLNENRVCPGDRIAFGVLVTHSNGELVSLSEDMSPDSFADVYRPRVAAALASNQYIDIADFQVEVAGPASYTSGHVVSAASDIATALGGPIRLTVRSRHHASLPPATAAIPVTFACGHSFGGGGPDGPNGRSGGSGNGGGDGTPGEPGEGGEPGQPGGGGPAIEVLAAPVRLTSAEGWIQVVVRMEGESREYLLAPGGRVDVTASGGNGGSGGAGGDGGPGYDQNFDYERATDGGPGGAGAPGGPGGPGGVIRIIADPSLEQRLESFLGWSVAGGAAGAGGQGGAGGRGGYFPIEGANGESADGPEGPAGPDGAPGADGEATIETRPMQSLFALDTAALEATIAAAGDTPDQHFDPTVPAGSGGGEQPAAATTTASAGETAAPTEAGGSAASSTPTGTRETNAGGGTTATTTPPGTQPDDAARRRLASGRFVIAPLRLLGPQGEVIAIVNRNGDIEMQGRVVARFDGGAVLRDGRIVMALERDGTLHIEQRGQLQPMGRIARDGHVFSSDGAEVTLSANGRITSIQGSQRTELRSHFQSLPANARQTAALVVLMASTNLR